jgi:DNA-binding CsgD family transcriptional regulator
MHRRLRDALAVLVEQGEVVAPVRAGIAESWQRSLGSGLRPERFEVPFDVHDPATVLAHVAGPVLDGLVDDLATAEVAGLLTDARGHVLDRRVGHHRLEIELDRIHLAPGFVYAETATGTNAIGTAAVERAPCFVDGQEHFAEALTRVSCAAAPVTDPRSGRLAGVVDLTCRSSDASPLMLALARRAARDIEQRLIGDLGQADAFAAKCFLDLRRRAKGPIVFVTERTIMCNPAADPLVTAADRSLLWEQSKALLARVDTNTVDVVVSDGRSVAVTCEPVTDGGALIGAVLRLVPAAEPAIGYADDVGTTGGWQAMTDTERSVAGLVSEGLTNREVGQRLMMSRYTVDTHLRAIFRKLAVTSRVELARISLRQHPV